MASAAAAEARRKAASTTGYYNLKLGPTAWNFSAGLGLEYNDNVNLTQNSPEADLIFLPQINTRMRWPVSDQNSINLGLGAGYAAYLQHPDLDRPFITADSDSGLSFDLYVGDFWINLHDRVSITENAYQDPSVAGTGAYSQLQNSLGVTTVWDLNKVLLQFDYNHVNQVTLTGNQGQSDGQSEVLSASAGYALKPGVLLGVELGGALLHYTGTNTPYSDASQWNAGAFYETQVSEYVHFRGSAGYTVYTPESSGTNGTGSAFDGMYAQLALTHRVNRYLDYSLSGGRTISSSLFGGATDLYYANLQANWNVLRGISLPTSFIYNHGTTLVSGGETYDQYGPQITLGRSLTANLSSSLAYQFYWRGSDLPNRNYMVNVVSLNFSYRF